MKALQFTRYAKPSALTFADVPRPSLQPHEMLVEVHAVGLNPVDTMIPRGEFKPILRFSLPATLGSDVAGVVVEVGSQVTRFKPGDAIYASVFDTGRGTLADYAVVPERLAAKKPSRLSFVEAASIPMVALTSWQALKERAHLKRGQKVFIPAGSGGVGTFAIQLATHLGAKVGTTVSQRNVDLVRSLGATEVIDYKEQDFSETLRDYDVVLGTVRGNALRQALRIVRPQSSVVSLIGPPDVAFARARGMNFILRGLFALLSAGIIRAGRKRGASYSFLFVRPDGGQLAEIGALLEAGKIRPVIDKVFPFDQAKEAFAYLEKGRATGKVVVQMK